MLVELTITFATPLISSLLEISHQRLTAVSFELFLNIFLASVFGTKLFVNKF